MTAISVNDPYVNLGISLNSIPFTFKYIYICLFFFNPFLRGQVRVQWLDQLLDVLHHTGIIQVLNSIIPVWCTPSASDALSKASHFHVVFTVLMTSNFCPMVLDFLDIYIQFKDRFNNN